jgi:serine/threonine-protein kinase
VTFDYRSSKLIFGESAASEGSLMIGKTVGHYRITSRLGAGGMGEVFLAVDTRLERKAAIKFLPAEVVPLPLVKIW